MLSGAKLSIAGIYPIRPWQVSPQSDTVVFFSFISRGVRNPNGNSRQQLVKANDPPHWGLKWILKLPLCIFVLQTNFRTERNKEDAYYEASQLNLASACGHGWWSTYCTLKINSVELSVFPGENWQVCTVAKLKKQLFQCFELYYL